MDAAAPLPDAVCEGGDLDCGSGLLLLIRDAMRTLPPGGVLEVRSRESSVREDLPAWCRMVGHAMLAAFEGAGGSTSYFLRKRSEDDRLAKDLESARNHVWRTRVRWTGRMQAKAFVRNHGFAVGQPASFDTEDPAPSAVEYLLAALGGAVAVGFAWRASRRGLEVRNLEVALHARAENILVFLGIDAEGSPGLAAIEGSAYVDCDGSDGEVAALWRETMERCPVAQTLRRGASVAVEIRRSG